MWTLQGCGRTGYRDATGPLCRAAHVALPLHAAPRPPHVAIPGGAPAIRSESMTVLGDPGVTGLTGLASPCRTGRVPDEKLSLTQARPLQTTPGRSSGPTESPSHR